MKDFEVNLVTKQVYSDPIDSLKPLQEAYEYLTARLPEAARATIREIGGEVSVTIAERLCEPRFTRLSGIPTKADLDRIIHDVMYEFDAPSPSPFIWLYELDRARPTTVKAVVVP